MLLHSFTGNHEYLEKQIHEDEQIVKKQWELGHLLVIQV